MVKKKSTPKKPFQKIQECRACRETAPDDGTEFDSLFGSSLHITLSFLTGISIPQDTENCLICSNCKMMLEVLEDFRKTCLQAALHFQKFEQVKVFKETFPIEHGYTQAEDDDFTGFEDAQYEVLEVFKEDTIKKEIKSDLKPVMTTRKKVEFVSMEGRTNSKLINESGRRKRAPRLLSVKYDFYCCEFCPSKRFKNKDILRHHLYQNHFQPKVICDFCGAEFQGKYKLQLHMQNLHMPNSEKNMRSYICGTCGVTCEGFKAFKRHKISTHYADRKTVSCDICGKALKAASVRFHKERVHKNIEAQEVCEICGARFRFKSYLKTHMESHNSVTYKCPHCLKDFGGKGSLREHIKYTHEILEPEIACPICGKVFKRKKYIKRHMEIHTKLAPPRPPDVYIHPCDECHMRFKKIEQLNKHKKIHQHKREATLTCKFCLKICRNANHLTTHQHRHNGMYPYKCEVCAKGFALARDKDNHMKIHKPKTEPTIFVSQNMADDEIEALIETVQVVEIPDPPVQLKIVYENEFEVAAISKIPKIKAPKIKIEKAIEEDDDE